MRVEWGDHGAGIDPQNTLPHVESIRNNLVFYPLLQKNGGFSVDMRTYTSESAVEKVAERRMVLFQNLSGIKSFNYKAYISALVPLIYL